MTKLGFILASTLILLSGNALAEQSQELGVYIAGAGGWTHWDDDNAVPSDWCCMDDEDYAYQVSVGYKFNRYFAMDARYNGLGKYKIDSERVDFTAWSVNGVGIWPISDNGWELFGQLGLGAARADAGSIGRDNESMWTLGAGVRYSLTSNISLSTQFDAYSFDTYKYGNDSSARNIIYAWTVGAQYLFK